MSGWPTVRLEDCAEIVSGATPSTSESAYWDGDICWATPKDLSELEGACISDTPRKISHSGLQSCAATVLPPESVLFSSRAPIGHVAINTVPMATNQGFKSFVPNRDRVHAKFLYHWLRRNRPYLESLGNGATFKEVSKAVVSRIEIALPPLPDQRRIAEILDKADALRAKRRTALTQLDTLTQSIFLDMFGDPAANPRGWKCAPLSAYFELKNGANFSSDQKGRGLLMVDVLNMYTDDIYLRTSNLYRVDLSLTEERLLKAGDLLFVRSSVKEEGVGWPALFPGHDEPVTYCGFLIRARPMTGYRPFDSRYLVYYMRQASIRSRLISSAGKVAITNINQARLGSLPILQPPEWLQEEFAARIRKIEQLRRVHRSALQAHEGLFVSLQHRAFSGAL